MFTISLMPKESEIASFEPSAKNLKDAKKILNRERELESSTKANEVLTNSHSITATKT